MDTSMCNINLQILLDFFTVALHKSAFCLPQFLTSLIHFKELFRQWHLLHYSVYTSFAFLRNLSSTSFSRNFPLFNSTNSTKQNLHWNLTVFQPTVIFGNRLNPKLVKSNKHFTLRFSNFFLQPFAVMRVLHFMV
jgi:hypothetical protein